VHEFRCSCVGIVLVRVRVATKWVSGYFAKYETGRNKTFFSRNFGGIVGGGRGVGGMGA
jgi:hypothetical protein